MGKLADDVYRLGKESLQMDFAAFYTAGEALNQGLSPYVNYASRNPPIWDGVSIFQHSRFLYPPLAAIPFRLVALLPYSIAKYLWMLFNLFCVGCSLFLVMEMLCLKRQTEWLLVLALFTSTYYPLLTLLERGQIDGVTLLLITLATRLMVIENNTNANFIAGILWAIAALLKLHCTYIAPFFLIRRKWTSISGYILGILSILLLSLLAEPHLSLEYLRELPRIAQFGEGGNDSMRLPPEVIQTLRALLQEGYTQKGGTVYRYESFHFISNASLVRSTAAVLWKRGINVHPSVLSALFLGFFSGILWIWQIYRRIPQKLDVFTEVIYWQSAWVIILLSAPLTWVMNTVWLLPIAGSLLCGFIMRSKSSSKIRDFALVICTIGLFIAWIPDCILFTFLGPTRLINAKYLFSEILVLVSLLLLIEASVRSIGVGYNALLTARG